MGKKRLVRKERLVVKEHLTALLHHAVPAGVTGAVVLPFLWMVTTSLKSSTELLGNPGWIPQDWAWKNYVDAWQAAPFGRYFANSVLVAVLTVGLQFVTSALAAYAFARIPFPGRDRLFALFLGSMMIPEPVTLVPNYVLLSKLGWINSFYALIIPWGASAFSIFLLRQFFKSLPKELEDAARIDGCSRLDILWRIVLPLSKPALLSMSMFAFVGSWNAFLWPLIATNSESMRTVQVGVSVFAQDAGTHYSLLMAAATFTMLPMILLFFFVQRYFVEGIARSGIKE